MANKNITARDGVINSQDTYILGDGSKTEASHILVHLVGAAWTGTIKVKARASGKDSSDDSVPFVQVPYIKRHLNGTVADDSRVSTDITTDSIIVIPSSGQTIALDCTSFSGGTMEVYSWKLVGPAA